MGRAMDECLACFRDAIEHRVRRLAGAIGSFGFVGSARHEPEMRDDDEDAWVRIRRIR